MLKLKGYFSDDYALQFLSHSYRVPESPKPVTMRSLDPNRLDAYHEYPRDTSIYRNEILYHERVDYEIHITSKYDMPWQKIVSLWLIPNEFTQSKEKLKVFEGIWSEESILSTNSKNFEYEVLRKLFIRSWKNAGIN